jgi:hypothetical protein
MSPWIKGAIPDKPVATNIHALKRRYLGPWNLGCIVMKMVNVPKIPTYQSRKRSCQTRLPDMTWRETKTVHTGID